MSHFLFHMTSIYVQKFWGKQSLLEKTCALDLMWPQGHGGPENEGRIVQVYSHHGCCYRSS